MELSSSFKHKERLNAARPQQFNINDLSSTSYKWAECKVLGKNISIRSYAGACTDGVFLYVYGGLQILKGTLKDFARIRLDATQQKFEWEEVETVSKAESPGPRAKHALVYCKGRIFLIGGIRSSTEVCNDMFVYDLATKKWTMLQPKGDAFPSLESFGCCYVPGEQDRIFVCCGYEGSTGSPTSNVYSYNVQQNQWKRLYDCSGRNDGPIGRSGCGCSYNNDSLIYVFGGKAEQRLNDLWQFDIRTNLYERVKDSTDMRPNVRDGHSMNYYDGKLYVFGGIHEVTWELDDLHIFDTKNCKWTTLEVDSARKKQTAVMPKLQELEVHPVKQEGSRQCFSAVGKRDVAYRHGRHVPRNLNYEFIEDTTSTDRSPNKMRDQQRQKAFMQKKAQLLETFELPEAQKQKFLFVEPASQAMKNSLDVIGLVSGPAKVRTQQNKHVELNQATFSKFMQPLVNNTNLVARKRPCARDGHSTVMIGNDLIFFGGDRHQMSFNDLYKLNMLIVRKQFDPAAS